MSSWASRLEEIPRLGLVGEPAPLSFAPRLSPAYGGSQTLAGWPLGTEPLGARWSLEAFAGGRPSAETLARARKLAAEAAAVIGYAFDGGVEIFVDGGFLGAGYGIPSPEGQRALPAHWRPELLHRSR